MYYKQYTIADQMIFWPHNPAKRKPGEHMESNDPLRNMRDTPPVVSEIFLDGKTTPVKPGRGRAILSYMWIETGAGPIYKTLPGDGKITKIANSVEIKLWLESWHEYVDEHAGDYWAQKDAQPLVFKNFRRMAIYFANCEKEDRWLGPEHCTEDEYVLTEIFLAKDDPDIKAVNKWSFMAHMGFFLDSDDPSDDQEKAQELGVVDHYTRRTISDPAFAALRSAQDED